LDDEELVASASQLENDLFEIDPYNLDPLFANQQKWILKTIEDSKRRKGILYEYIAILMY
jgi:hypothetical protein